MTETSDDALMIQIAAGNAAAAQALLQRLGRPAYGYAFRLTGHRDDAEDIAQEALLRLVRIAPSWQSGQAGVRAWLWRVITNLAHDRGRGAARSNAAPPAEEVCDDGPNADQTLQQKARAEALQTALLTLPNRQRQAVVLRYIEELSIVEAAEVMGISPTALDSLAMRARRALAAELGPKREELGSM